ncbi:MAG: carbohydrate-binding domain-containing protein, partial [Clostridiales Family XIII bacterium]|nr:carbohydrate-binding domain-containing protein [Clostridiales Family XIII bacterium]
DISITASDDGINAAGGSSGIDDDDFGTGTDDALIPGARPDGAEWGKDQSGSGNAQGVPDDAEGVTPVPGGQGHGGGRPSGGQGGTGTPPVMPDGQGTDGAPVIPDGQGTDGVPVMPGGPGTDGTSDGQGRAGAGGFGGAGGGFGEMAQTGVFLRVTGGTIDVYGGGDGIDANGDLYIDGGEIKISGPSEAMECAIDLDGTFTITGGKLITAGNAMAPDAVSTQNTLRFSYTEQQASGSFIEVKDKSGAALLAYESRIGFSVSAFSSPELKEGETYAIYINEEKLAEVTIAAGTTSVAQDGGSYVTGSGGGRGGAGFGAIPSGAGSPSADGDAAAPPAGGMPFSGEPPASGGADTGIGTEGGEADADAA